MLTAGQVRATRVGIVEIDHPALEGVDGDLTTTISVGEKRFLLKFLVNGSEASRIDEHVEDPNGEEDVVKTVWDVVTPPFKPAVRWDPLLTRIKAMEEIETHPTWDR